MVLLIETEQNLVWRANYANSIDLDFYSNNHSSEAVSSEEYVTNSLGADDSWSK